MVYELRINTLGVALHWENDAQMASLSAAVNPVVPTNTNNITSNSDFSSKNPTTGVKPEGCQGGSRPADKAMDKLFPNANDAKKEKNNAKANDKSHGMSR